MIPQMKQDAQLEEEYNAVKDVLEWAARHPEEWLVVCGIRSAGRKRCEEIRRMLYKAKLYVLCELMAHREYQMALESDERETC